MPNKSQKNESVKTALWYAEFLDGLPMGVYRSTVEGTLVFVNQAFAKMFGFESTRELIDYPVLDLYHDKMDRGHLVKLIMGKGHVEEVYLPLRKKDRTLMWGSITARAVSDEDGIVVFIDGFIRDVTAEVGKHIDEKESDEKFRSEGDFIVILSLEGEVLDIQRAGTTILGFPKEEVFGKRLSDIVVHKYRDSLRDFFREISKSGHEQGILTIRDGEGRLRNLRFQAYLVKENGEPHHIKAVVRDATESLRHQRAQLTAEKFKGILEMAGGVAHRLSNPLTIVNNLVTEIIADPGIDEKNRERMARIHDQVKKMNELAKKIASIKKYEAMDYVGGIKIVDLDKTS
jgi:PAS domain S-box-containing protein